MTLIFNFLNLPNLVNLLHKRKKAWSLRLAAQVIVWKANSNPSTTMPGHSFQADLSVYRADIKLRFAQRMFPQGSFSFRRSSAENGGAGIGCHR